MKQQPATERKTRKSQSNERAFTRIDVVVLIMVVGLLACLTFPLFARDKGVNHHVACFNNLRQIGQAVHMWGSDHQDQAPWRTLISQGGTQPDSGTKPANAWSEFAVMSNQLVTPRILTCPADIGVQVARNFSEYVSPAFRPSATSYSISMHPAFEIPASILCVDRNVLFSGTAQCAYGVINASTFSPNFGNDGWTNAVHGLQGHILRMDGGVVETDTEQLRLAVRMSEGNGDNPIGHFLKAR